MTQRIFDIKNEKDMQDLWDILPEKAERIIRGGEEEFYLHNGISFISRISNNIIKIEWHDAVEIRRKRTIQEATEQDIGKLCIFWVDDEDPSKQIGLLTGIEQDMQYRFTLADQARLKHCRRLTQEEIEELC